MNEIVIFLIIIIVIVICVSSILSFGGAAYEIYKLLQINIPFIDYRFRTVKPLGCSVDQQLDAGLCYPFCDQGYSGIGPLCWPNCPPGYTDTGAQCTKKSYGRGVGVPLICSPDEDLDGGLCYPKCANGFSGVGPVCWQNCPPGFPDGGTLCGKPPSYGRGAGYWSQNDCQSSEQTICQKWGLLWYPDCATSFYNTGCCICTPYCPAGMTNFGAFCQKGSYGRGAGVPVHACPPGYEKSGELCYPVCQAGYTGEGPVCWQECPEDVNPKYKGMFIDTGFQCTKISKGRGAGVPIHACPPNYDKIGLLCYGPCDDPNFPIPDGIYCKKYQ